jgi:hypothetical protein
MPAPYRADGTLPEQNAPLLLRRWESPEALREALQAYVEAQREAKERPLWTGVARVAGLESRQTLWRYLTEQTEGVTEEWVLPLKEAALAVEEDYERLLTSNGYGGAIFALKQRDWSDVQTVKHDGLQGVQFVLGTVQRASDADE